MAALPNLLIIGAMKCGTTSLHSYLDLHPEVGMSAPKELNFFAQQGNWHRGRAWYEGHFDEDSPIRGESSPSYAFYPFARGVPERAAGLIPEARLMLIVRDPISRIVSHYLHRVTAGRERRPFDLVLESMGSELVAPRTEPATLPEEPGYLARSLYAVQLQQWQHHFPASSILVIDHDDLMRERDATLSQVAGFLGIADDFPPGTTVIHNRTDAKRRPSRFGTLARRVGGARAARRLPPAARGPITGVFKRVFDHIPSPPELSHEQRARLENALRPDVDSLRAQTGKPFGNWSL